MPSPASAASFTLASSDIAPGKKIGEPHVMDKFGCHGGNRSPELHWSGAPAGTKSFVVTVYDPDAPTGSGWWHWVVYDIPATATGLPAGIGKGGTLPAGAKQGRGDVGPAEYDGPCPPVGDKPHRYIFTVHALKVDHLDVPADASPALVGFAANANEIGRASFTAMYGR
ncbi:MAG: YbhB/YbcL family Raf kinase inhibitor-like protein [Thermoanaerobaculia bacterium]